MEWAHISNVSTKLKLELHFISPPAERVAVGEGAGSKKSTLFL